MRVLLVEDEYLIRELASEDLADAGFEVIVAESGDEAVDLLAGDPHFDLVFTDIRMPGEIDGWELGRRARTLNPRLGILYASGYSEVQKPLDHQERFVKKPYRVSEVVAALRALAGDERTA